MRVTEKIVMDAYKEKLRAGKASIRAKATKPYDLERVRPAVERSVAACRRHEFLERVYFDGLKSAKQYYSQ